MHIAQEPTETQPPLTTVKLFGFPKYRIHVCTRRIQYKESALLYDMATRYEDLQNNRITYEIKLYM